MSASMKYFLAASETVGHCLHLCVRAYKKSRQHPDTKQGIKTPQTYSPSAPLAIVLL